MSTYEDTYPPIELLLDMGPEELAPFVLKFLSQAGQGKLNKHNFSLGNDTNFVSWTGHNREKVMQRLIIAWAWLERELLISSKPGQVDWYFITPAGERVLESEDFTSFTKGELLHSDYLDPILKRNVKPLFLRGDYDTAVFRAFKEVEVRVRKEAGLDNKDIGVNLMKKAFNPKGGPLLDVDAESAEQEAMMFLFAGSIGLYKNPSSHRHVDFDEPDEVADIIHFANHLLRVVESIGLKVKKIKAK